MTIYKVYYDPRYQIKDNTCQLEASDLNEAKQKAVEYAVENSPHEYDFNNYMLNEVK